MDWIGLGLKSILQKRVTFFSNIEHQFSILLSHLFELNLGSKRNAYYLFTWLSCRTVYDLNH